MQLLHLLFLLLYSEAITQVSYLKQNFSNLDLLLRLDSLPLNVTKHDGLLVPKNQLFVWEKESLGIVEGFDTSFDLLAYHIVLSLLSVIHQFSRWWLSLYKWLISTGLISLWFLISIIRGLVDIYFDFSSFRVDFYGDKWTKMVVVCLAKLFDILWTTLLENV